MAWTGCWQRRQRVMEQKSPPESVADFRAREEEEVSRVTPRFPQWHSCTEWWPLKMSICVLTYWELVNGTYFRERGLCRYN